MRRKEMKNNQIEWADISCMHCGDEDPLWPRMDDTVICDNCLEEIEN
jgi:ribosomal protein S27E